MTTTIGDVTVTQTPDGEWLRYWSVHERRWIETRDAHLIPAHDLAALPECERQAIECVAERCDDE